MQHINLAHIDYVERRTVSIWEEPRKNYRQAAGLAVHFAGGGHTFVEEPAATALLHEIEDVMWCDERDTEASLRADMVGR